MCNQFNGLAHFPLFISIKMFKLPKLFLRNVNTYAIKIDNLLSYLKKKRRRRNNATLHISVWKEEPTTLVHSGRNVLETDSGNQTSIA